MIACILIAGGKRTRLIDRVILPSMTGFDEVMVVGEHHEGEGFRYLAVPALQGTTNDALVKRDVGTLATTAEVVVYLSDDHRLGDGFASVLRVQPNGWDVLMPNRFVTIDGYDLRLNNGEAEGYCGGHAGVYQRSLIQQLPWTAGPHHPNWDLLMSRRQQALGAKFASAPELVVFDVEPGATPWR